MAPNILVPAVFTVALTAIGCASPQGCETKSRNLGSARQDSALGFSLEDVLAARASQCYSIHWLPSSTDVTFSPNDEVASLSLGLQYVDAPIVERTVVADVAHDPEGSDGCVPALSTTVEMTVATSDGALNEQSAAAFTAYAKNSAGLEAHFNPHKLRGDLRIDKVSPPAGLSTANLTLSLSGVITPQGESGSIVLSTGASTGSGSDTAGGLGLVIASWQKVPCQTSLKRSSGGAAVRSSTGQLGSLGATPY